MGGCNASDPGDAQRDVALTSVDNVVNYRLNAGNPSGAVVVSIGGGAQRFQALIAGSVAASMTAWLDSHRDVATRFTRAFFAATRWSFDPANHTEAIQLLMSQPNTTQALAERLYTAQTTLTAV